MPTMKLVLPMTNHGTCRSCGAAVDWYTTWTGKAMPMNVGAQPLPTTDLLDPNFGVFDTKDSHWATCPDAAKWKART
jgi:hypothetical protein